MLKTMRDSFKHLKWILFLVIFVFILLVFVDWGGAGRQQGGGNVSGYAARVNGDSVSIEAFNRALVYMEKQYQQVYGQPLSEDQKKQMGLRRLVLNSLVVQQLLMQQAESLHLGATPKEVRNEILRIPALSPDGQFVGADLYARWVMMNGYRSAADFEAYLARDLTLAKMDNVLASSVVIAPEVVQAEYRRRTESTTIRYVLVPTPQTATLTVTPAEVEAHYRAHSEDYRHPQQKHVKYLLADLARIRQTMSVTADEVREAYEASKEAYKMGESVRAQHILLRTPQGAPSEVIASQRKKADEILERIHNGEDFGALAKEFSEDPGSAANEGNLGWFQRGQMVPPFEEAAFSLQPGQISAPVQSEFGWHIVKLLERREGGYRTFEEVRREIEAGLVERKAVEAAREAILRIRATIGVGTQKSDAEVRALANDVVSYNDAGWVGRTEIVRGLGRLPALNDWAFNAGENALGDLIDTPRGPIIPHLVATRDAGVTPMEEIRPRVEGDAKTVKARDAARQKLEARYKPGASLEELAQGLSVEVKEATIRAGQPVPGFVGNAKALADAATKAAVGQFGGPLVVDQGAVIFQVTEQNRVDRAEFEKARAGLEADLRKAEAQKIRASLVDRLRRSANIILNESLFSDEENPPSNS